MAHHTFEPDRFHTCMGGHEPALEISSGDSVTTSTVDSNGFDRYNRQVTPLGNPQTGPFFIRGAAPGDTLAVRFDRLYPNRTSGRGSLALSPNVLDPGEVLSEAYRKLQEDGPSRVRWKLDLEAGTAEAVEPHTALEGLRFPLVPMLGCFGVAPPFGQSLTNISPSVHGGNMDYNGFVEGVTVYLPVFVEGALFYLGDGHALQGDGEIAGSGIETSFDVTFSVRLIKGQAIGTLRAEDDVHIMTVGNARPLDRCIQMANSEMLSWLQRGYGLEPEAAHILLGNFVRYDVGNMVETPRGRAKNFTAVCKIPKAILKKLKKLPEKAKRKRQRGRVNR